MVKKIIITIIFIITLIVTSYISTFITQRRSDKIIESIQSGYTDIENTNIELRKENQRLINLNQQLRDENREFINGAKSIIDEFERGFRETNDVIGRIEITVEAIGSLIFYLPTEVEPMENH